MAGSGDAGPQGVDGWKLRGRFPGPQGVPRGGGFLPPWEERQPRTTPGPNGHDDERDPGFVGPLPRPPRMVLFDGGKLDELFHGVATARALLSLTTARGKELKGD